MRNTKPEPPFDQRATPTLIEDLCLALREVGVGDLGLPDDERRITAINTVQRIHTELQRRDANFLPRIAELTEQTKWQMEELLRACLAYPQMIPYVREKDGIRRAFRCYLCQEREFPDRKGLSICDHCLEGSLDAICNREPIEGLLILRIDNSSYWCKHADPDTVMAAFDNDGLGYTWCAECVSEERARRASGE